MLKFLGSPELLFWRGAVKNFIFRSEIANFWNLFAATGTRHQQRKTENDHWIFIILPDFIMKSKSEMKCLYVWVKIKSNFLLIWQVKLFLLKLFLSCFKFNAALFNLQIRAILSCILIKPSKIKILSFFALKSDTFKFRYILENTWHCIAITDISRHCHIKKRVQI